MNRIDNCFKTRQNILSVYFTAGYPTLNDTGHLIAALDREGADMIEIGIPFSDPVADGPVIQASSKKALDNGMSLNVLFDQLKDLRKITDIPVILMGYLNPVYKMGMENFLEKCQNIGIDGVILPDFPPEEYENLYIKLFEEHGIYNIMLITPQTPEKRIRKIDSLSRGFIYMVSSYSTTGVTRGFGKEQRSYFQRIREMKLKNPGLVGFGIHDHETFKTACEFSRGAIIGSEFIKMIGEYQNLDMKVKEFIKKIKPEFVKS